MLNAAAPASAYTTAMPRPMRLEVSVISTIFARQIISGPGIKGGIEFLVNTSFKVGACGLRISNMTASAHELKMLTVGDLYSWLCMEASEREVKAEEDWESYREESDNMI